MLDFTFWKYSRGLLPSSCSLLVTMVRDQSTVKLICCILYFGNIQGASLLSFRNNWKYSRGPLPSSCSLLVTMVRSLLTDTSILLPHHHLPLSQAGILIFTWRDLNHHLQLCILTGRKHLKTHSGGKQTDTSILLPHRHLPLSKT